MNKGVFRIFAGLIVCLLLPSPGMSEAGQGSFKRVKPPEKGASRLINIQIEPVEPVKAVLSHVPDVPPAPDLQPKGPRFGAGPIVGETADWFWTNMSPSLRDAGSGKLSDALTVLAAFDDEARALTPRASRISAIGQEYGAEILKATAGTQISPALVLAVMTVESNGRAKAKSSAGAVGLMQLMPATAKRFGVTDREDPAQSIAGGVKYLNFLLAEFGGDALLAVAAYNAGEGAVHKAGGVPNYKETRKYVPKVVAAWSQARLLCLSPPNRATDGCVFAGMRVAGQ